MPPHTDPAPPRLGEATEHGPDWMWPQFQLRTLMLFVLLVAAPLSWWGWRSMNTRRQESVIESLAEYDVQAGWLSGNVVQVTFRGARFKDKALPLLGSLPKLERLVLIETEVTAAGVGKISMLPLRELKILRATQLKSDKDSVFRWPATIESLWIEETAITDAAIESFARLPSLVSLSLIGNEITDESVASLGKLKQLEDIYLQRTAMTKQGVDALQRELPKAVVNF